MTRNLETQRKATTRLVSTIVPKKATSTNLSRQDRPTGNPEFDRFEDLERKLVRTPKA